MIADSRFFHEYLRAGLHTCHPESTHRVANLDTHVVRSHVSPTIGPNGYVRSGEIAKILLARPGG